MNGGKGEPSKTGAQSALLVVPPNCAALVRGTGGFICHILKTALRLFAAREDFVCCPEGVFEADSEVIPL